MYCRVSLFSPAVCNTNRWLEGGSPFSLLLSLPLFLYRIPQRLTQNRKDSIVWAILGVISLTFAYELRGDNLSEWKQLLKFRLSRFLLLLQVFFLFAQGVFVCVGGWLCLFVCCWDIVWLCNPVLASKSQPPSYLSLLLTARITGVHHHCFWLEFKFSIFTISSGYSRLYLLPSRQHQGGS